jgi:hypothetical protein
VQSDQGDPAGGDRGRQQRLHVGIAWPVNAATAIAWNSGYSLAGVPTSGCESIHTIARSSR